MIVSGAPNCGITYDHHYDNRNSFIIQGTSAFVQANAFATDNVENTSAQQNLSFFRKLRVRNVL